MELRQFGSLTQEQINNIEKILTIELPEDYKQFLARTDGGVVEKNDDNKIHIDDLDADIVIDVLYGASVQEENASILHWMEELADELWEDTIIIGDNLLQGLIVMVCKGENKGIYYWDDAYNFESSDDESNLYWITETFTEFLQLLQGLA
jgi:hypothetical protein